MTSFTQRVRDTVAALRRGSTAPPPDPFVTPTGRCQSRKVEGKRSWRCTLHAGHERARGDTGELIWPYHTNFPSGRRSWL